MSKQVTCSRLPARRTDCYYLATCSDQFSTFQLVNAELSSCCQMLMLAKQWGLSMSKQGLLPVAARYRLIVKRWPCCEG